MAIASRIVGLSHDDPASLTPNPYNYRVHPELQRDALRASLAELGWIDVVIVNDVTGNIIDGHLRVEDALEMHELTVPVLHVELDADEEHKALMTLDPLAALAIADASALAELNGMVETDSPALSELWMTIVPGMSERAPVPDDDAGIITTGGTDHECPQCGYRWHSA